MADDDQQAQEWFPHAEKQFGSFDRTLRKHAPRRIGQLHRIGAQTLGLVGARRRGKRR